MGMIISFNDGHDEYYPDIKKVKMAREEIGKVFDWLEKEMNKKCLFDFKLEDRNQITAYFSGTKERFCQFYIKPILKIVNKKEGK